MKRLAILFILALASVAPADYLGTWNIGDYVTVTAATHRFSTGAAYAATGDVHLDIYEDDTAVQIVDDTDMANFDAVTGLYLVKVQLLAATGFEAGKHYTCVIAATVDGVAGICTHNFQILAAVNPAPAGSDWADGGRLDLILDGILADTNLWDTANEARTLLTGGTDPLSTLTTANITSAAVPWQDSFAVGADAATKNSFILAAGPSVNNWYMTQLWLVVVQDESDNNYKGASYLRSYNAATKTITLNNALPFTPAQNDDVWVIPVGAGSRIY